MLFSLWPLVLRVCLPRYCSMTWLPQEEKSPVDVGANLEGRRPVVSERGCTVLHRIPLVRT